MLDEPFCCPKQSTLEGYSFDMKVADISKLKFATKICCFKVDWYHIVCLKPSCANFFLLRCCFLYLLNRNHVPFCVAMLLIKLHFLVCNKCAIFFWTYFFRVSSLAYPNLLGKKGYVVVVVVVVVINVPFSGNFNEFYD